MPVQTKICGLKTEQAVTAAVEAGADFVGFVDYPSSPRHIAAAEAKKFFPLLTNRTQSVIVTVDPHDAWIDQVNFHVAPDYIQLHGNESPARVAAIKSRCIECKIIKAIAIRTKDGLENAASYAASADMLMFDAKPEPGKLPGGNGVPFDWRILKNVALPVPWFLSGGLNASNVKQAISQSGAQLVDVSSGVESAAGVKDEALIKQFILAARS